MWAREDEHAYFLSLILHAWGMALLAGGGMLVALAAVRGSAAGPGRLVGFLPVLWTGLLLAAPSGLVLLLAYPAKALTNPVFAIKLTCLVVALLLTRRLVLEPARPARLRGAMCLLLWMGGVIAGKLLLHTYRVLMVS